MSVTRKLSLLMSSSVSQSQALQGKVGNFSCNIAERRYVILKYMYNYLLYKLKHEIIYKNSHVSVRVVVVYMYMYVASWQHLIVLHRIKIKTSYSPQSKHNS